jgi:hypothetical protein
MKSYEEIKAGLNEIENRIDYSIYNGILFSTNNMVDFMERTVHVDGSYYSMDIWLREVINMFKLRKGDLVYIPYGGTEIYGIFESLKIEVATYGNTTTDWVYTPIMEVRDIFTNSLFNVYEFYEGYQDFNELDKLNKFYDKFKDLYKIKTLINELNNENN